MAKRRFVLRTIKNGSVTINGKTFKPDEQWMKYDGRLDGMRYAFGLYYTGDKWEDKFVNLWGSEKAYLSGGIEDWPGKECVNDCFNWAWWRLLGV